MTVTYKAPLRDMEFVYYELLDGEKLMELPGYEEADCETIKSIWDGAAQMAERILFPLNRSGDEEGCHFSAGQVTTPKGFKEAYTTLTQDGWTGITADPEYGGMGLPHSVGMMVSEMKASANQSLSLFSDLGHGAYNAIKAYGSQQQKDTFLQKLIDGTWCGTMCLTEAQCGTDLGLITTKAEPRAEDGVYKINGSKIFISAGEHDLSENIIHLVLARLPDAPTGIKGISLFLVPKFLIKDDLSLGKLNGVSCGSIEHKMGIRASPTCVLNFDNAEGYLVGKEHKGMEVMFVMMNSARLNVGVQGLAVCEQSYQGAVNYARERLQMRSLTGAKYPELKADPIIVHPDIRRMLLTIRAYAEGCRALSNWIFQEVDHAENNPDPKRREEANDLVSLLTPVIKAFLTDVGFESANLGVQIYGGHGYIREHGMEQYVRDARINQIYEGTNGIQALDLVGRKMSMHEGRYLHRFFKPIRHFISIEESSAEMIEFVEPLAKAFGHLQKSTEWIAKEGRKNPDQAGSAAVDYLRLFGLVALGYLWARMAKISLAKKDDAEKKFYSAKVKTARFYMQKLLPQTESLLSSIISGSSSLMDFDEEFF